MSEYTVVHGGLEEANASLNQAVLYTGVIISDLGMVLRTMGEATQGQALPLWADLQAQWNAEYEDLQLKLRGASVSSDQAADIFKSGDTKSGQIMGGA